MSECSFGYGYEWYGVSDRLVITPLTERAYLAFSQACRMKLGAAPTGPAGTGKTETVKDLAKTMGRLCVTTNCSEALRFDDVSTILRGLCGVGAWGCFDEFNRISAGVLSVVA